MPFYTWNHTDWISIGMLPDATRQRRRAPRLRETRLKQSTLGWVLEGSGKNDMRKCQRSCRRRGFPWRPLDAMWGRARPTVPNARLGAGRRARGRWQDRVDWISSSSFAQTLSTYVHQGHCAVACSCFSGCTQHIQPSPLCLLAQDVNWPPQEVCSRPVIA